MIENSHNFQKLETVIAAFLHLSVYTDAVRCHSINEAR